MYDIYSNAQNDTWRYSLGKSGRRKLITIGLNPSTATQEKSDTTVAKVEMVAKQNGFDGFIMLNLYPVRATDFKQLPKLRESVAFEENIKQIESIVLAEPKPVIWAAWGESIRAHTFFVEACIELFSRLKEQSVDWRRFGELTVSGHPRHPSRLNYAWNLSSLEMDQYVCKLRT